MKGRGVGEPMQGAAGQPWASPVTNPLGAILSSLRLGVPICGMGGSDELPAEWPLLPCMPGASLPHAKCLRRGRTGLRFSPEVSWSHVLLGRRLDLSGPSIHLCEMGMMTPPRLGHCGEPGTQ